MDLDASIDRLEQELIGRETLISEIRQQQAELLRTLDFLQVERIDGARSLQEWTRARLDIAESTASDLVHAARSLKEQPQLAAVREDRRMSFDRLVATSRLAVSGTDEDTIIRSFGFDLAGVTRLRAVPDPTHLAKPRTAS